MLVHRAIIIFLCLWLVACDARPGRGPTPVLDPPHARQALVETAPATESSRAMLEAFYHLHLQDEDSGVPDEAVLDRYRPYLSERLAARLEKARRRRDRARTEHPDDKPPFVEGDLFSSLFEGPTNVDIGRPERRDDEHERVPMVFSHVVQGEVPVRWTDYALMVHEEGGWKLDDVEYGGDGPFATRGRLSEVLKR